MKIQKFNESLMTNKIDVAYKKTILYECEVLKDSFLKKREESLEFINDYIQNNDEFKKNHFIDYKFKTPSDNIIIGFEFENYNLILSMDRNKFYLKQKETLDLLKYLSDTELLRDTKKYNL